MHSSHNVHISNQNMKCSTGVALYKDMWNGFERESMWRIYNYICKKVKFPFWGRIADLWLLNDINIVVLSVNIDTELTIFERFLHTVVVSRIVKCTCDRA